MSKRGAETSALAASSSDADDFNGKPRGPTAIAATADSEEEGSGTGKLLKKARSGPSGNSVVSGGASSASKSSRQSAAEMVRRGVAFRASRMEHSLLRLRNSVLLTFLIAAVISVMAYVVTNQSFQSLLTNLLAVVACSERAIFVQRGVEQVQEQLFQSALQRAVF